MLIELTSGKTIEGKVLGKSLNCLIVRDDKQEYLLVSKYALKDPEVFNFRDDFADAKPLKDEACEV